MDRYLTIADLAHDKGGRTPVPEATWRYWRRMGVGPKSVRIGRRVVYRERDVDAWFADHFDTDDQLA